MLTSYVTLYSLERAALELFSGFAQPVVRTRSQLYGRDSFLLIPAPRCIVPRTQMSLGATAAFILQCGVADYTAAPLNAHTLLLQAAKYRARNDAIVRSHTQTIKAYLQRAEYALPANSNNILAIKRALLTAYEDFLLAIPNYPAHEVIAALTVLRSRSTISTLRGARDAN